MQTLERTYLGTHPWLTFRLDLQHSPWNLWMLLGEARSQVEHLAESLLSPETGARMMGIYLAKGVHATTAIEGNTLSEEEVVKYLESQHPPSPEDYREREVANMINAYSRAADDLLAGDGAAVLSPATLEDYNRLILDGLELEDGVVPGAVHERRVGVGRYLGPPSEECRDLLEQLCDWLNGPDFEPKTDEMRIPYAVIKAIIGHLYFVWIHPFGDGNGRTGRLLEYRLLFASGLVPAPAAHLLSSHYNVTRSEYYRRLDASTREDGGDPAPFLLYAVSGLVEQLRSQLRHVWEQLYDDRWEQYVYQHFGEATSTSDHRRRQLVLDLSKYGEPVARSALRTISGKVASGYAGKTDKTLTRDINALLADDLIVRRGGGFTPRREKILAFLPARAPAP